MSKGGVCLNIAIVLILFIGQLYLNPLNARLPQLYFRSLTVDDGLPQNSVKTIYQDKNGFMWFGIYDGLCKYDGENFQSYDNILYDSVSTNYQLISNICEDSQGIFWISTSGNGIILFDKNKETVTRIRNVPFVEGSLNNNNVMDIYEDFNKDIWVATWGSGLNFRQKGSNSFKYYRHNTKDPQSLGSDYISSITADSRGNLWMACNNGLLCKYDIKTNLFESYKFPIEEGNMILRISMPVVYIDSDDNILFGTEYGLCYLDSHSGNKSYFPRINPESKQYSYINSIIEFDKGIYLIATNNEGLYLFNIKTGEFSNYMRDPNNDAAICSERLLKIYKSNDGIVWISSHKDGISIYNKNFNQLKQLKELVMESDFVHSTNTTNAFCVSADNKIWMGTEGQGINIYDPKTGSIQKALTNIDNPIIKSLYRDHNNNIWIGTLYDGLYIYDWKKRSYKQYKHDAKNSQSISSNSVFAIFEDSYKQIWVAYTDVTGLDILDSSVNKIKHFLPNPDDPNSLKGQVFNIIEDRAGRIWIGALSGLLLYNKEKENFTRYPSDKGKRNGFYGTIVYDLLEDSYGRVWVGTERALNLLDPATNTFTHYTPITNRSSFRIMSIIEDQTHRLWVGTSNNIFKFEPETGKFRSYINLGSKKKHALVTNSSLSYDGKLYFGNVNGVYVVSPDEIVDDTTVSPVFITEFSINNIPVNMHTEKSVLSQHINITKHIKLTYKQSTFSFLFAALNYALTEEIQYAYMLDGVDRKWVYSGDINRASYTKIAPGHYTFKVKATDKQGEWNEKGVSLQIIILPPWWNTLFFRISFLLVIIGISFGFYFYRINSLRKQKVLLENIVKERTGEVEEKNAELIAQTEEFNEINTILEERQQHIEEQDEQLQTNNEYLLEVNELLNTKQEMIQKQAEDLKGTNDKLLTLNATKDKLFSIIAHDLRNPFNTILGFSEVLLTKFRSLTEEKKHQFIKVIFDSSQSIYRLLENLLQWAQTQTGDIQYSPEVFDLNDAVDANYDLVKDILKEKEIVFNKNIPENSRISADRNMIDTVIRNLLGNAIKYTEKGEISIATIANNGYLEISIADSGIGIPENKLHGLFEIDKAKSSEGTRGEKGSGLGLLICKEFIEENGGEITVKSIQGKGTTFTFTIPHIA